MNVPCEIMTLGLGKVLVVVGVLEVLAMESIGVVEDEEIEVVIGRDFTSLSLVGVVLSPGFSGLTGFACNLSSPVCGEYCNRQ